MNNISFFNEVDEDLSEYEKDINKVLNTALKNEKVKDVEFNIIFVDEDYIHNLNKTYRGIDRVTDVISFALEDDPDTVVYDKRVLGDIYICVKRCHEQAIEYGHSFKREICFLSVHGLYHLLGYDHQTKEEEDIMFGKQEEALQENDITR